MDAEFKGASTNFSNQRQKSYLNALFFKLMGKKIYEQNWDCGSRKGGRVGKSKKVVWAQGGQEHQWGSPGAHVAGAEASLPQAQL